MKSNISNSKIKYILLSIIFSILFIITALQFQTPLTAQARQTIGTTGTAEKGLTYNPSTKSWEATGMGESGLDGIVIPDTAINGSDTAGSLAPTYTYWAGGVDRSGVICYVIDLSTNKMDSAYKPFIMVKNYVDANNANWRRMVNTAKFPLRTGDTVFYSEVKVHAEESLAPVFWSGDSWASNEAAVEADLLTEDPTYQYKMFTYWKTYGGISMPKLKELAEKVSDQKVTLAFETVSAQSLFLSTDPNSREHIQGGCSEQGGFTNTSSAHPGEVVRCFTTEYGFAQHYASKGITGLEGSTLNWKWFQATAGSMILQESAAGINVPNGNTSIGSISSSEAATQNNGYAIIMLKITLPPIHTFDGSNTPGDTETPDPGKGTDGDCTIKKLYYTQVINPDGTVVSETVDNHFARKLTTNYISIDSEDGYEIEGWKSSTSNKSFTKKATFKSISAIQSGTSSEVIKIQSTSDSEKYLYILYKKIDLRHRASKRRKTHRHVDLNNLERV